MKAAFFTTKPWEEDYLRQLLSGVSDLTLDFYPEDLRAETLPPRTDYDLISVFVGSVVNKPVFEALPNLKCVVARSTGFDHIDLATARERNVVVSYVPSYGENTVAEYAFALLLALSRKIYQAFDQIKENANFKVEDLRGFDLRGKTIGVVGTGRIGRHAIGIAKGFGMQVLGYDPFPNQALAQELGFTYLSLPQLLAKSDVITLHVPYAKETHHLINTETLKQMKPGAYLINTSRGAVVETEALIPALKSGQLGGVGMDVFEEEKVIFNEADFLARGDNELHNWRTIIANHVLIDLPNVIVTPHNAFNTTEAIKRILETTAENIKTFLAGNPANTVK
ncbi:MAG: hydroxyacid dehydrogenase [Patescibacteria group bacterium]